METYYTVYKIVNHINKKIYIGKHKTQNLNDDYFGSGKYLKRAISKYGIENFTKEILFIFDNEEEMNNKEAELVSEDFVAREDTYNLCIGGKGGFSYINDNGLNRNHTVASKNKISESLKIKYKNDKTFKDSKNSIISKMTLLAFISRKVKYPDGTFKDKNHSEESKKKIGKANSVKQSGSKNSQFGTKWIHNLDLKKSKKIKKEDQVPEGWTLGRKLKF